MCNPQTERASMSQAPPLAGAGALEMVKLPEVSILFQTLTVNECANTGWAPRVSC